MYDAKGSWSQLFAKREMPYPPENLIRILRGTYPRLDLDKSSYQSSKILDISCGEGRNIPLFLKCGFKPENIFATEIAPEIVAAASKHTAGMGVPEGNMRVGMNHSLPFDAGFFDYIVSWNACYYMQDHAFEDYVKEFARVCKTGAKLLLCIPKSTCFIFRSSERVPGGYCIIKDDYFKLRNGERMRIFSGEQEIVDSFKAYFSDFVFASVHDEFFGLEYHWHISVSSRNGAKP